MSYRFSGPHIGLSMFDRSRRLLSVSLRLPGAE